jgi:leucyl/phenylalanyl-tRNA--protein transferase
VALVSLVQILESSGMHFMDCQQTTRHLLSLGAREVPRRAFMHKLQQALEAGPVSAHTWQVRRLE